jgi:transcriptional regulator with XRE-family HTH domain
MICLHDQIESQLGSFGVRLQQLRLGRGWSLRDLADRSGLSKAFLSRLESGDRQASIAAVLTLSRIFDVSLASLFEAETPPEPCIITRRAGAVEHRANGLVYVPLSMADRRFNIQPLLVRVSRNRRGSEHYHHEGEEWLYVLSGALTLSLAGKTYDLEAGDSAHFDSRLPHRLIARGGRDAEVLVVAGLHSRPELDASRAAADLRAIPRLDLMERAGSRPRTRPHALPSRNPTLPAMRRKQPSNKQ